MVDFNSAQYIGWNTRIGYAHFAGNDAAKECAREFSLRQIRVGKYCLTAYLGSQNNHWRLENETTKNAF